MVSNNLAAAVSLANEQNTGVYLAASLWRREGCQHAPFYSFLAFFFPLLMSTYSLAANYLPGRVSLLLPHLSWNAGGPWYPAGAGLDRVDVGCKGDGNILQRASLLGAWSLGLPATIFHPP